MAIIFADIDNNLQYIKPENVVFVKHNDVTSEVGLATTNIKGEPINHVTKNYRCSRCKCLKSIGISKLFIYKFK